MNGKAVRTGLEATLLQKKIHFWKTKPGFQWLEFKWSTGLKPQPLYADCQNTKWSPGPYTSKGRGQHGAVPKKHAGVLSERCRNRLTSKVTALSFSLPRDLCHSTLLCKPCSAILSAGLEESHSLPLCPLQCPLRKTSQQKRNISGGQTKLQLDSVHHSFLQLEAELQETQVSPGQLPATLSFPRGLFRKSLTNSFFLPQPCFYVVVVVLSPSPPPPTPPPLSLSFLSVQTRTMNSSGPQECDKVSPKATRKVMYGPYSSHKSLHSQSYKEKASHP